MNTVPTPLRTAREHVAAALRLLDDVITEGGDPRGEHFDPSEFPERGVVRGNEGWNNLPGGTS